MKSVVRVFAGRARWVGLLICLVTLAVTVAACGSSDSSSSSSSTEGTGSGGSESGVAEAKQAVEAASAPVEFTFDTPLPNVEKAQGAKVYFLANLISLPFVQNQIKSLEEAFGEVGVTMETGGANGNVGQAEALLKQAVARGYDAVIINSIPSKLLTNGLKEAKEAGVPVIQQFEGDPHAPGAADTAAGIFGYATYDYSHLGRLMADWVIADSDGSGSAAGIGSSDAQASVVQIGAAEKEFAAKCPECEVKVEDVLLAEWATRLGPVTSTLVGDPSLEYLLPVWDGMLTYVTPSVSQAGATERVQVVTSNADEAPMEQLASGEINGANVGTPVEWAAWATADQTLRALVGVQPVPDEQIPLRIFDSENIGEIDVSKSPESWYGSADFRAEYRKLWGA